ncbi:TIGR00645 family protein, partial [Rhodopseudomonas palustris]
LMLLIKFGQEFIHIIPHIFDSTGTQLILYILQLVDLVLIANLLLMIIFSGYENFVSKIDMIEEHVDRPEWMGKIDSSALKLKLIGSIVAISSIELLRDFMQIGTISDRTLAWRVGIHMTFVVSGVLFALMERLSEAPHHHKAQND